MTAGRKRETNIGKSLPICSASEISAYEPCDDEINHAYNIFDAEKMKYYKNVFVRLDRDFTSRKRSNPAEWRDFSDVVKICKSNNFNLECYIKYSFINRLVVKSKGRVLSDISYLRNTPQIMAYAKNIKEIERLFRIYRSIQKSILLVRKIVKETNTDTRNTIKKLLSSGKLSIYISTGVLSPYFVSLIPNSGLLIHKLMDGRNEDRVVLIDFCNRIGIYGLDAQKSMSMFYPNSMKKNIVELCS